MQPSRQFEEGAEQGRAIIVHQLDQSGLLHQAAEFDQVTGASAPVLDPLAFVAAVAGEIEPIAQHGQPQDLGCRYPQLRQQGCWLLLWSPACRLAERRPAHAPSTS